MKKSKELSILVILLIILSIATLSRWIGFNNPHFFTFDEGLYARLGLQLKTHPFNYTSKAVYKYYISKGRPLPDYLNKPLFKHPPVFSYLISLSHFILDPSYLSAFIVSLIFGIIIIIVTFCVGTYIFNKNVGLFAALLVAIDPIHWFCSQKIWMETTLAAFIWISLFFLMKAILDGNYRYFFWAGISTGFAILTKYPGFIIFPIGFSYVFLYNRKVLKSKYFWSWPLISFILFIPWIVWNYSIYKAKFFIEMIAPLGGLKERFYQLFPNYFYLYFTMWSLGIFIVLLFAIYFIFRKKIPKERLLQFINSRKVRLIIITIGFMLLFTRLYMIKGLINMFNIYYMPLTGWKVGMFLNEPWYFYFRQLIELSPFYMISLLSVFFLRDFKSKEAPLFVAAFWIMFLFIWHGSFQSRYILATVPAFLIISSSTIIWMFEKIKQFSSNAKVKSSIYRIILTVLVIYCFIKTILIDLYLALPNNICYF